MSTVELWRKIFNQHGIDALAPKPRPGRTPKLDGKQLIKLKRLLKKGATKFGYANAIWTSRRVRRLIEDQFNVTHSARQVRRILRKIGYSPKKPVKRSKKYSPQAVEHWLRYKWPHIKKVA
jgi:transposase